MDHSWEDFEADVASASGRTRGLCTVRTVLESLAPVARGKLQAALDNPAFSNAAIAKILRKRLGESAPRMHTVARHRRGDCSCP